MDILNTIKELEKIKYNKEELLKFLDSTLNNIDNDSKLEFLLLVNSIINLPDYNCINCWLHTNNRDN